MFLSRFYQIKAETLGATYNNILQLKVFGEFQGERSLIH